MKKSSTIFLQVIIVLIGVGALALLLWEPHLEGVNADSTFFEVYLDPFVALVYIGSIPFFAALYQAVKVLRYAGQDKVFSQPAVNALRTIKYCALIVVGSVVLEEIFIMLTHGNDDAAGGIMMGVLIIFGSIVIATAAALFERVLQNAVDIKSENDLTV
ncbi:MAG: hypothetical protein JWO00_352 [Candidatus Parcubacteria bacterium]|nr:hypothetical protein [Candidatus Parcubacteria bacterium]